MLGAREFEVGELGVQGFGTPRLHAPHALAPLCSPHGVTPFAPRFQSYRLRKLSREIIVNSPGFLATSSALRLVEGANFEIVVSENYRER